MPGRPTFLMMTGSTMLPPKMMNRRSFLSFATAVALCAAGPAHASYEDQVIRQLRKQGYTNIVVTSTLLGRLKISARRSDGVREIILNPRTGEILRDYISVSSGEGNGLRIAGDEDASGDDGGTDDGSGGDDDNGGDDSGGDDSGEDDSGGEGSDDDSGGSDGPDDDNSGSEDDSSDDDSSGSDDSGDDSEDDSEDNSGSDDSDDDKEDDDSSDD